MWERLVGTIFRCWQADWTVRNSERSSGGILLVWDKCKMTKANDGNADFSTAVPWLFLQFMKVN